MGSGGVTSTRAAPASIARLGAGLRMKKLLRATRKAMRRFMACQESGADLPAEPAPRQAWLAGHPPDTNALRFRKYLSGTAAAFVMPMRGPRATGPSSSRAE